MSADPTSIQTLFGAARRGIYRSAAATFAITFAIAWLAGSYFDEQRMETRRLQALLLAQNYAQRIQDRLQSAVTAAYVVGAAVKQSGGKVANFDDLAVDIMASFPVVSAVELAPGGVIAAIHPMAGNQAALGHNLLKDRNRNREAHMAIATRQITLAGPFELLQGGMAAVARLPVFLDAAGESRFWGFAIVLIRIPNLLETAGLGELAKAGYRYELWRLLPDTEERFVFARRGAGVPQTPAEYSITVPNGRWTLALAPDAGWDDPGARLRVAGVSLLLAICLAGLNTLVLQSYLRTIARARIGDNDGPR